MKKRLVIGIDASRANREKKTGVEWYAYHVIEELKNIITDTPVVLYSEVPLSGPLAVLPENWTSKVLRWPPKRLWTQVRLSWEMFRSPVDVLFVPAHVPPLIHPERTVMTVHDVAALEFPESYNRFERWYSVWSVKRALKSIWKIITPSRFTQRELEKLRHSRENIFVVPHGFSRNYAKRGVDNNIDALLEKYYVRKPYIMTIGRLEEKKNTRRLVEAFGKVKKAFPNIQLLLVGKQGYGYEKVKAAIEQSPYKQDIIQPGWVSEEDMPRLMGNAELFVFPSLYEGFGIPVLEAMACGTPVLASSGSSLEEVGGEGALYAWAEDVSAIARAIETILRDGDLRKIMIAKGYERTKQFSWEKCGRETCAVLVGDNM